MVITKSNLPDMFRNNESWMLSGLKILCDEIPNQDSASGGGRMFSVDDAQSIQYYVRWMTGGRKLGATDTNKVMNILSSTPVLEFFMNRLQSKYPDNAVFSK